MKNESLFFSGNYEKWNNYTWLCNNVVWKKYNWNLSDCLAWGTAMYWLVGDSRHHFFKGIFCFRNFFVECDYMKVTDHFQCLFVFFSKTPTSYWSGAYSEPSQISRMELFLKITNDFQPLTIFAENSVLDDWRASECASVYLQKVGWSPIIAIFNFLLPTFYLGMFTNFFFSSDLLSCIFGCFCYWIVLIQESAPTFPISTSFEFKKKRSKTLLQFLGVVKT